MADLSTLPGLPELWERTRGEDRIRVAVLDGPVDLGHPALAGAALSRVNGVWPEECCAGPKARHGTQVASVLFGQPDGPVPGVAPGCAGLSVPVFSDRRHRTSQLELARGIELAVEAGAHVINISGGQYSPSGRAEDLLDRAIRLCRERNVLVVAAAGNDGCFCDHVPAALPSVLAVGALDDDGRPLDFSNWGPAYQDQGILAPGQDILTAVPGGGTSPATGTSVATPVVAGVAALLLSLQVRSGQPADPLGVRAVLLATADPCDLPDQAACKRFLAGRLNIGRAVSAVQSELRQPAEAVVQSCECAGARAQQVRDEPRASAAAGPDGRAGLRTSGEVRTAEVPACPCPAEVAAGMAQATTQATTQPAANTGLVGATTSPATTSPAATSPAMVGAGASPGSVGLACTTSSPGVQPAQPPGADSWAPYVYALGVLGYDFGTEARRDSFKQLMAPVAIDGTVVPANPYDARQMVDHLVAHPSEAKALTWTLNLELTPIYAIEPVGPYAASAYDLLATLLGGQIAAEDAADFIERVSLPGRLTDRSVKLFSGQVVPVIEVEQTRGLYGWRINALLSAATEAAAQSADAAAGADVSGALREFLTRVYYDLRNLGSTSHDRALNFAATNAFQAAHTFAAAVAAGMALDTIEVEKSPFCRMDSDCWDVKLRFFDPENSRRARKVFRFTIDVSDILPVTLGVVRTWSEAG